MHKLSRSEIFTQFILAMKPSNKSNEVLEFFTKNWNCIILYYGIRLQIAKIRCAKPSATVILRVPLFFSFVSKRKYLSHYIFISYQPHRWTPIWQALILYLFRNDFSLTRECFNFSQNANIKSMWNYVKSLLKLSICFRM